MNRLIVLALLLLLAPTASAQPGASEAPSHPAYAIFDLRATASNQRVDLVWEPTVSTVQAPSEPVYAYRVYVFEDGREFTNRTVENQTSASFLLTNGRTYAFQVAAIKPDGAEGPRSDPVAATPRLENDLAYLAAGLIAVWVGLFGYAAFLARKEASIDAKLERILQARFQGRSP